MPKSRDLIQRVAREIEASRTISPTPPGQSEKAARTATEGHVDAINQVFALFRLNYHNQYYAAFPDAEQLKQIKKLWLDSLLQYPVEQILKGAKHAIENSEYLPTLHRMHECCREQLKELGLPTSRDAYLEACSAQSPRAAQHWSHPAVYLAGRDSDWFFLSTHPQQQSWPVFRDHYQGYCRRVLEGEQLTMPVAATIEQQHRAPLSADQQLAELQKLRRNTGL